MAKGKHATALFEVIHSAKANSSGRTGAAGLLRTPKWWFKGRDRNKTASTSNTARGGESLPLAELMPAFEPVSSPSPKSSIPPINLGVDPEKQQITFKLTYSGTIIASFAVVVVIGLAYVIGRHGSGVSSANASVSTEQIKSGPVRKDVLNVSGAVGVSSLVASNTGADVEGYANHPAKPPARSTNDAGKADPATPAPAPASDGKAQRIIGMQYVIMQSYPDQPDADEAVALLKQNGIEASVEKLPWYSKWPTVVGATGFDRLKNNPQYDRYIESIEKVSAKFAGRSKFKRFTPQAVRWK